MLPRFSFHHSLFTISPLSSFSGPISRMLSRNRYGPVSKNSESAINVLLDIVRDQSGKQYKMDHYATRYPTNVLDIASFLVRLCKYPLSLHDSFTSISPSSLLSLSNTIVSHRCLIINVTTRSSRPKPMSINSTMGRLPRTTTHRTLYRTTRSQLQPRLIQA